MTLRVLHVLDHSIPLRSGYTFRTLSILREQRRLGWQTFHLTSPKHSAPCGPEETVDRRHFRRTPAATLAPNLSIAEVALMKQVRSSLREVAQQVRPRLLQRRHEVRSEASNV